MASVLKQGSRGKEVIRLQNFLSGLLKLKPRLTADGIFGPKTKAAVTRFQKKQKLTADALVGPKTWDALGVPFAEKVSAVFSHARVNKIDFHLGSLHISPQRIKGVGQAIADGRITVEVASTGQLLGAAYSPHSNKMTLGKKNFSSSVAQQAGIIHEGAHALVDMYHLKTTVLNDEAAAYLTEAIYLRAAHRWIKGNAAAMRIYSAADSLAKTKGLYQKRGVTLSFQDAQALRKAIQANPAYQSVTATQQTTGHGIP